MYLTPAWVRAVGCADTAEHLLTTPYSRGGSDALPRALRRKQTPWLGRFPIPQSFTVAGVLDCYENCYESPRIPRLQPVSSDNSRLWRNTSSSIVMSAVTGPEKSADLAWAGSSSADASDRWRQRLGRIFGPFCSAAWSSAEPFDTRATDVSIFFFKHCKSGRLELPRHGSARYPGRHHVGAFAGISVACACVRICSEISQKLRLLIVSATCSSW